MRSPRRHFHSRLTVIGLLAIAGTLLSVASAGAEAQPTRVILSYVPTISTWGPNTANGVVVYTLEEGDVRADLLGLPVLGSDESYELWLVNTVTGDQLSLVRFNAVADTQTTFIDHLLAEPIPDIDWDQVRVTVEPEPDADSAPDSRIALVGSVPGTAAEVTQYPEILPETGVAASSSSWLTITIAAGLMTLGTALIVSRSRRVMQEER
jgi:hypothetical protein